MKQRRAWVRIVVTMLGAALAALALFPGPAQASSLVLHPTHDQATAPFKATYTADQVQTDGPPVCPAGDHVEFYWDGETFLGVSIVDSHCRASLHTVPPAGASEGTHEVLAGICEPYGDCGLSGQAEAEYTIGPAADTQPGPYTVD